MAESFSREKLRQAPQKEGVSKILCYLLPVTPAGTSIEVQNEWEENTQHTHIQHYIQDWSSSTFGGDRDQETVQILLL